MHESSLDVALQAGAPTDVRAAGVIIVIVIISGAGCDAGSRCDKFLRFSRL